MEVIYDCSSNENFYECLYRLIHLDNFPKVVKITPKLNEILIEEFLFFQDVVNIKVKNGKINGYYVDGKWVEIEVVKNKKYYFITVLDEGKLIYSLCIDTNPVKYSMNNSVIILNTLELTQEEYEEFNENFCTKYIKILE